MSDTIGIWAEASATHASAHANGHDYVMGNTRLPSGMPWPHRHHDLIHFREATRNRVMLMGRNTFNTLPEALKTQKALFERPIVIITRNPATPPGRLRGAGIMELDPQSYADGSSLVSLGKVISILSGGKDLAVIGGPKVLEYFEPMIDRLLVSTIYGQWEGDIPAPSYDFVKQFPKIRIKAIHPDRTSVAEYRRNNI